MATNSRFRGEAVGWLAYPSVEPRTIGKRHGLSLGVGAFLESRFQLERLTARLGGVADLPPSAQG